MSPEDAGRELGRRLVQVAALTAVAAGTAVLLRERDKRARPQLTAPPGRPALNPGPSARSAAPAGAGREAPAIVAGSVVHAVEPAADGGKRHRAQTGRWRTLVIAAVIAALAALPWLVPAVPGWFGSAVPGDVVSQPAVEDPPVGPAEGFVGPVGTVGPPVVASYEGVRLASAGKPLELLVPRLGVRSPVVPISGQSGALVPPSNAQILGWWQEGGRAGLAAGSAVVTGHTVHTGGGAFDHLARLAPGDSLRVRTPNGWIRYLVRRSRVYSVAGLARNAEEIFRLDGSGRLVLITCDDWNGQVYLSNAVVYAEPVGDQPFAGKPAKRRLEIPTVPDSGPRQRSERASGNT